MHLYIHIYIYKYVCIHEFLFLYCVIFPYTLEPFFTLFLNGSNLPSGKTRGRLKMHGPTGEFAGPRKLLFYLFWGSPKTINSMIFLKGPLILRWKSSTIPTNYSLLWSPWLTYCSFSSEQYSWWFKKIPASTAGWYTFTTSLNKPHLASWRSTGNIYIPTSQNPKNFEWSHGFTYIWGDPWNLSKNHKSPTNQHTNQNSKFDICMAQCQTRLSLILRTQIGVKKR